MSSRSLQEDLLRIPGVEGADVEGSGDKPAGLRIRIAEGADQQAVGAAIRRVLTEHGLGTDTRLPGEPDPQDPSDAAAGSAELVDDAAPEATETESDNGSAPVAVMEAAEEPAEVIDLTDGSQESAPMEEEASSTEPPAPEAEVEPAPAFPTAAPVNAGTASSSSVVPLDSEVLARIDSVAVAEGREGIVVTVTSTDGRSERRVAASTEGGVESAVVRATARLALPKSPEARVVEVEDRRVEGIDIVMIVLDVDGSMAAGSAVVGAGRAFALGRATWAALTL